MADNIKNFAYSTVLTAPTPAASGTSLVVQGGDGTKFPTVPFNATVWPVGVQPTTTNAEIVRVTAISTDTFTITRTQESTSARTIVVGDQIAATITAKALTDRASLADANNYSAAQNEAKGADIASATTTDIGAATGNYVVVTGTTTITGLGTIQAGTRRIVKFAGILTLTYNATSLILPTSANITTAADDTAVFVSLGGGNWVCTNYQRKNGTALASSGGTERRVVSTRFESLSRFTQTATAGGIATLGTGSLSIATSATISSAMRIQIISNITYAYTADNSKNPAVYFELASGTEGTDFQVYMGFGQPAVNGAGHTFTNNHTGIKVVRVASGAVTVSATNANGTTETATAIAWTTTDNHGRWYVKKTTVDAKYYLRGTLLATHTTNLQTAVDVGGQFSISNVGVATNTEYAATSYSLSEDVF